MLSDERGRRAHAGISTAHPPRNSAMLLDADFGMVEVNPIAALFQMGILGDKLVGCAYCGGHARSLEDLFGLGGTAFGGPGGDRRFAFVLVLFACGGGGEARIARQLGLLERAREPSELGIVSSD